MSHEDEYWEKYITYWLKRVGDSNNQTNRSDHTPDDLVMLEYINLISQKIKNNNKEGGGDTKVLDYGCGFGRAYPFFYNNNIDYYGCDIAQSCIDYVKEKHPSINAKKLLSDKSIPYLDNFFDGIFCYGVFDACTQNLTLLEILRKLKNNGILLLTGKNIDYFDDDSEALYAETKARENGHPNFFTDLPLLLQELKTRNFNILETRFFLRRSDGAPNRYTMEMSDKFYTFILLIQKTESSVLKPFENFSHKFSRTFKRCNEKI